MKVRIFVEPQQGATYEQLLAVAQATEALGFDAFFRSDHYLSMGGDGLPGPTDAWVTLAALARETSRIRLGTLVSSATFRWPGVLAITVAQVDAMSGGRVELGLGTGWYDGEHTAYGIPFPPLGERFERLEEQLAILTGLWATPVGETFSYAGDALPAWRTARPCPSRSSNRIRRSSWVAPAPSARPGWRPPSPTSSTCPFTGWRTRRPSSPGCARPARAATVTRPVSPSRRPRSSVAAPTRPRSPARARAIGREVDELRTNGAAGTPDEVVARLRELGAAGAETVYLQVLDLDDLDHLGSSANACCRTSA